MAKQLSSVDELVTEALSAASINPSTYRIEWIGDTMRLFFVGLAGYVYGTPQLFISVLMRHCAAARTLSKPPWVSDSTQQTALALPHI